MPAATITTSASNHHTQFEVDDDDAAPGAVEVVTGTVDVVVGSDVLVGATVVVVVGADVVVGAIVVDVGAEEVVVTESVGVVEGLVVVEMPPKVVVVRVGNCEGLFPPHAVMNTPHKSIDAGMPKARFDFTLTPLRSARCRTALCIVHIPNRARSYGR